MQVLSSCRVTKRVCYKLDRVGCSDYELSILKLSRHKWRRDGFVTCQRVVHNVGVLISVQKALAVHPAWTPSTSRLGPAFVASSPSAMLCHTWAFYHFTCVIGCVFFNWVKWLLTLSKRCFKLWKIMKNKTFWNIMEIRNCYRWCQTVKYDLIWWGER